MRAVGLALCELPVVAVRRVVAARLDDPPAVVRPLLAVEELVELAQRLEVGRVDARGQEKREQVSRHSFVARVSTPPPASSQHRRGPL